MKNKPVNNEAETISESELRDLRDRVFGRPMSDQGWEICKVRWQKPEALQWLKEKAEQPI